MDNLVLPKLSYRLMSILYKIQNELGSSLLEKYYQRAIEQELEAQKFRYRRELPIEIRYQNKSIGRYFLDFVIEDLVVLEVKAQPNSPSKHFKEAYSYLKQTNTPLGLLVNFRENPLSYIRIINPDFKTVDLSKKDEQFEII